MNEDGSLKEVVETVVKALVDYPDQVEVKEVEGEATTVIELRVAHQRRFTVRFGPRLCGTRADTPTAGSSR